MARIIVSTKKKEKTVPVNYKIQPLTKSINQLATEYLKKMSPESGVNYSEFIDDIIQAVLESDLVIYQIDDNKYTLKDIINKYFDEQEEKIKTYIKEDIQRWIYENEIDIKEDIEGQGEVELEDEIGAAYEAKLEAMYQEIMDYGDGTELLYEKIKDDIQVKFGPVFDVAEKTNLNWARRLERYIEIVHEREKNTLDNDLMTIIGILFKNTKLDMFKYDDFKLIYEDKKSDEEIKKHYIHLRLLLDRIIEDYGNLVFIDTDEITMRKIIIDEALKDDNLKYIAKKARYLD